MLSAFHLISVIIYTKSTWMLFLLEHKAERLKLFIQRTMSEV